MKTSHSGVFGVAIAISLLCRLCSSTLRALCGIASCRLAHPGALIVRLAACRDAIPVAWAVAGEHLLELGPVDLAVAPVPVGVLNHAGIGNGQAEILRLRHGGVDELLPQLVIGEALDLPLRRGVAV